MVKDVIVKKTKRRGKGLFALRNFKKGEIIVHNDMTKLKKYTLKEIRESSDGNHADYVGHGKYVIDNSLESYANHCCDPNSYIEFKTIGKKNLIALKSIKKGEEITKDYTLAAIDQIKDACKNMYYWKMKCNCGSKNCRKIIYGDFFKLPKRLQKEKLKYLPTWTKRKYRDRIKKLR